MAAGVVCAAAGTVPIVPDADELGVHALFKDTRPHLNMGDSEGEDVLVLSGVEWATLQNVERMLELVLDDLDKLRGVDAAAGDGEEGASSKGPNDLVECPVCMQVQKVRMLRDGACFVCGATVPLD